MATGNTVTIVGNATREPELRFTQSGKAVANFGIAISHRWFNKETQQWDEEEPDFFDVTCWGEMAENASKTIEKGTRTVVMGHLKQRSWDDKDTGAKRTKVEIMADEVAPSLRWAEARVIKNEKRDNSDGGSRGGGRGDSDGEGRGSSRGEGRGSSRGEGRGSSRGSSGRGGGRAASQDYSDEPF